MYRIILLSTAIATALPVAADASPMNRTANNALRTCENMVESKLENATTIAETYHERNDGTHYIYLNVNEQRNGDARQLRATCKTTALGRRVLEVEFEPGKWVTGNHG